MSDRVKGRRRAWLASMSVVVSAGCSSVTGEPEERDGAGPTDDAGGGDRDAGDATTDSGAAMDAGEVAPDGGAPDGAVAPGCTESRCSGHGRCEEGDAGAVCRCDEGFSGASCEAQTADFHRRSLLVPGMADPDILKEHDDLFVLTGTARSSAVIPLYESSDLVTFRELPAYDPTALDTSHDYCYLGAPDLTKYRGQYDLYFSAHRVAQGAQCPPPSGQDVTTFHVSAASLDAFGVPALHDEGAGLPQSRIESGCGAEPCVKTVRIDAAAFDDGEDRWFFYVWFTGGNNIASYRFDAPQTLIEHAGPASFTIPGHEESINEAPDLFLRDGRYYMFFSGGFFNSQYAMYYVMADSVAELTRARYVRRHSEPVRAANDRFLETHGHNSVVERRGELFNVFHQGEFDVGGNFTGRSTHKQRITFRADGSVDALNFVDLSWSRVGDSSYSLDVVKRDGTVLGPCIAAGRLGTSTEVRFRGVCPDAGDAIVPRDEVATFRIYHSTDDTWDGARSAQLAYDGASDRAFIPIAGGTTAQVGLRWNELATGMEYSLDVQRDDGQWVAPCVGAAVLHGAVEHVYTGQCTTAGSSVAPADIQAFRLCAAAGDQWQNARCASAAYDGSAGFLDVQLP
jgi:hypothetical protein